MNGPIRSDSAKGPHGLGPGLPALVFALLTVPVSMLASISLTFQNVASGITITGAGTSTASLDFGTVSKYGSLGANTTRTLGASDFTVGTQMGVRVTVASEPSTSYTLRARITNLGSVTRYVNGVAMTTSFATVASTQAYSTTYSHTLQLLIPDSFTGSAVRDLEFQAVAN